MGYILLALFLIIAILCYLEDYIRKYQKSLFFLIGLVLIFVAGFREIGLDPDSENYEYTFQNYFKNGTDEMIVLDLCNIRSVSENVCLQKDERILFCSAAVLHQFLLCTARSYPDKSRSCIRNLPLHTPTHSREQKENSLLYFARSIFDTLFFINAPSRLVS